MAGGWCKSDIVVVTPPTLFGKQPCRATAPRKDRRCRISCTPFLLNSSIVNVDLRDEPWLSAIGGWRFPGMSWGKPNTLDG